MIRKPKQNKLSTLEKGFRELKAGCFELGVRQKRRADKEEPVPNSLAEIFREPEKEYQWLIPVQYFSRKTQMTELWVFREKTRHAEMKFEVQNLDVLFTGQ